MMYKQLILDVGLVLAIPVLIIGSYFMWFREESEPLLSASSEMLQTSPNEPGALTRLALQKLNSITLDASLFDDAAFLALKSYTVEIPTSALRREYPFTPTPEIAEILKRARTNSSEKAAAATVAAKSESIATKLNLLKTTTTTR